MTRPTARIEPPDVVRVVEDYINSELDQASKYDNRAPLDESGCWTLHSVAAQIYALGFDAGETTQMERERGQRQRDRAATRAANGLPEG